MKKTWIIFSLIVIIAAQWTFMSSFHSTITVSHMSGTRVALVSKLNYVNMRATIQIIPKQYPNADPVLVTFSNGSQLEITERYSLQVFLPKSGSINGDFQFSKILSFTPIETNEFAQILLSHNNPMDVDVIPDVSDDFLSWYDEPFHPDFQKDLDKIDIYWLKVEGDATISVSGYGAPF